MTSIKTLMKEYNIEGEVPEKFGNLSKVNIDSIVEHHTETHDGNKVYVFTQAEYNGSVVEWILDINNLTFSRIVKKDGQKTYIGYESYQYIKEADDILISVY